MGVIKKRDTQSTQSPIVKNDNNIKYTAKGNKLIEFTRMSNEEKSKLRVDAYGYIL